MPMSLRVSWLLVASGERERVRPTTSSCLLIASPLLAYAVATEKTCRRHLQHGVHSAVDGCVSVVVPLGVGDASGSRLSGGCNREVLSSPTTWGSAACMWLFAWELASSGSRLLRLLQSISRLVAVHDATPTNTPTAFRPTLPTCQKEDSDGNERQQ